MSLHGSKPQVPMGHFETRINNDTISRNASIDLNKPYHDLRVVRPIGDAGLEPYLPSNASEQKAGVSSPNRPCLDGVAKPLVDIFVGQANESISKGLRVEGTVAAFFGAKLQRLRPRGASYGKENLDIQTSSSELLRKQGVEITDPSEPNDQALHLTNQLQGDTIGIPTAPDNYGRRGQLAQEDVERDGMETSEYVGYADRS